MRLFLPFFAFSLSLLRLMFSIMLLLKGFALMCAVKTRTVQLYHRFLLPINALIVIKA